MKLANYSTTVPCRRSIDLIQQMLAAHGAKAIMMDYEGGEPSALTFRVEVKSQEDGMIQFGFRLPADWRRTLTVLNKTEGIPQRMKCNDQAKRIAWRTIHDWLRAQLALIETGAAEIHQVFLPYAITPTGQTLFEVLQSKQFTQLALPAPA